MCVLRTTNKFKSRCLSKRAEEHSFILKKYSRDFLHSHFFVSRLKQLIINTRYLTCFIFCEFETFCAYIIFFPRRNSLPIKTMFVRFLSEIAYFGLKFRNISDIVNRNRYSINLIKLQIDRNFLGNRYILIKEIKLSANQFQFYLVKSFTYYNRQIKFVMKLGKLKMCYIQFTVHNSSFDQHEMFNTKILN